MASADTCQLNEPHVPRETSIEVFSALLPEIKSNLVHLRRLHPPAYFAAVKDLTDAELTLFSVNDLKTVRVGTTAYGTHIFGKLQLQKSNGGYLHIRVFVGGEDGKQYKFHCIHIEAKEGKDGGKDFRAIMAKEDGLEWFNE